MIDIKAIKAAAIDSDETGFASVLTNNDTVIALCDEVERLRKEGEGLLSLDGAVALLAEVERLRAEAAAYHALRAELDKQMGAKQ